MIDAKAGWNGGDPKTPRSMAATEVYTHRARPRAGTAGDPADAKRGDQGVEWCVNFGAVLTAMDSGELWSAIERGRVTPATRVWREGMECWTPVADLSEFAPTLNPASWTAAPITLPAAPNAPTPHRTAPVLTPAPAAKGIRTSLNTLFSGPQTSSCERILARIRPPRARGGVGAQLWVALGSAVAASVITAAVLSTQQPRGHAGEQVVHDPPPQPRAENQRHAAERRR